MAGICGIPGVGAVCDTVGVGVQSVFQQVLDWMYTGLGKVLALSTSGWLRISTPGVAPLPGSGVSAGSSANGASTTAAWLQDHITWLSSWLAAVCLVVAGARMAYQMRGLADLRVILEGLTRLVLVNGIVVAGMFIATQIGDSYSNWIIRESLGDNADQKLGALTGQLSVLTAGFGGLAVPMILVGAALISSLLNLIIGFFRAAVLVVLAGTLSLPAAAALTDMGRRWLGRWLGWMLGFLCVKPAAATIYATAYKLNAGQSSDISSGVAGLALLAGAIVVLPALLRLFQPAGMALAGGSGLAGPEHVSGGGRATGSAAPSGATSSGGQAGGGQSAGGGAPSGASSSGGRAGLTSGQSSGVSSAAKTGATAGAGSAATSGGGSAGKGGGKGGASGSSGGGIVAAAALKAGQHARQQLVDGLREGAQGLDRELGDGPSGS
jgi:hypothetical protein